MVETQRPLLIIFYRNPRLGKVKTRLASTLGAEKALGIYNKLCLHTLEITAPVKTRKIVFYSDAVNVMDIWPDTAYLKATQSGEDLGERMRNAMSTGFETGYDSICIIGTDCYELTTTIIEQAFSALRHSDAVIGPAMDGGYYLLGMRKLHNELFNHKHWSTDTVCRDTIRDFERLNLSYEKLQMLRDVDTEADLPKDWLKFY